MFLDCPVNAMDYPRIIEVIRFVSEKKIRLLSAQSGVSAFYPSPFQIARNRCAASLGRRSRVKTPL